MQNRKIRVVIMRSGLIGQELRLGVRSCRALHEYRILGGALRTAPYPLGLAVVVIDKGLKPQNS